jgi:prepilin-type processing-associated H-X9-DG protein
MDKIQKRNRTFAALLVVGSLISFVLYMTIHSNRFNLPESLYSIVNGVLKTGLVVFLLLSVFYVIVNILSLNAKGILSSLLITLIILGLNSITIVPDERMPPGPIICRSNLKMLSLATYLYHEYNKVWPDQTNWCDSLKPYTKEDDGSDFQCPVDEIGPCSYAMNENIPTDANALPPDLVLLFESAPGWNQAGGPDDVVTDRHGNPSANIAFADGHVEFVEAEDIPSLRWKVEE